MIPLKTRRVETLLKEVMRLVGQEGYRVENVDATLVSEQPKISPKIQEMKGLDCWLVWNRSKCRWSQGDHIRESLDLLAEKKGLEAQAVVLLIRINMSNNRE